MIVYWGDPVCIRGLHFGLFGLHQGVYLFGLYYEVYIFRGDPALKSYRQSYTLLHAGSSVQLLHG